MACHDYAIGTGATILLLIFYCAKTLTIISLFARAAYTFWGNEKYRVMGVWYNCHMGHWLWCKRHVVQWPYGEMEMWDNENVGRWAYEAMGIWGNGNMEQRILEN